MKIILTGSSGFIGNSLKNYIFNKSCHSLILVLRRKSIVSPFEPFDVKNVDTIDGFTNWSEIIRGSDIVIHLAAMVHNKNLNDLDEYHEHRRVNVEGTLNLAKQAASANIKRFIYISSIGVNGTNSDRPFVCSDIANPMEPNAVLKWEAEQGLRIIQNQTGMEVVIIRPPLVYGPNAPGNFGKLVSFICKGIPLPFGAINNLRSFVGVDNLVDMIVRCIDHPRAANKVLFAGDGQDVSTTEFLRAVGDAMDRPARLIPIPHDILQWSANLFNKEDLSQRLLGSLQVDISYTCQLLDWSPPYPLVEGLRRCFTSNVY